MANVNLTTGGVHRAVPDIFATVGGVHRKVIDMYTTQGGVHRRIPLTNTKSQQQELEVPEA